MKLIHDIKIIMIILLSVTVLFALLGSFKLLPVEGFENLDPNLGCSGEIIPQCHENILGYSDYNEDPHSDYILKTEIVVPTCPTTLTEWDNSHDKKWKDWTGTDWDKNAGDDNEDVIEDDLPSVAPVNDNSTTNNSTNILNKTINIDDKSKNMNDSSSALNQAKNNKPIDPTMAGSNVNNAASSVSSPADVNDQSVWQAINDIKGSITQMNQKTPDNKETPPCPACERCPEPAFECKKVPNYRSSSINEYMPVPVLNNFSKF